MAFNSDKAKDVAKTAAVVSTHTVSDIVFLILKIIGTIILLAITTGAIFSLFLALYIRTTLEPQIEVTLEDYSVELTSYIYEMDYDTGEYVEAVALESSEVRVWVEFEEINQHLIDAAVAFEDKRYYDHKGVDWYRTAGAFYTMFFGDDQYGASTLTQQLIKNLTEQDDVTVKRKVLEIFRALELERLYDKDEIMEWYLNIISFGGRINGVGAAAQEYYGVDQSELTIAQCASIIGITQYPGLYNPYISVDANLEKRGEVLQTMYDQGYITYEEWVEANNEPIVLDKVDGTTYDPPLYTYYQETIINDLVEEYQTEYGLSEDAAKQRVYYGGITIYSAMDSRVQDILDEAYSSWETMPSGVIDGMQSAMMIIDHTNGHILGMGAGVGEKTINFGYNLATDARRPPGSSIKPIAVYGPALELGVIQPNDMFEDSPLTEVNGQKWPNNDNNRWDYNNINIVTAIQQSKNTISARVVDKMGIENSYDFMTNTLHVELVDEDKGLAPLALGQLTYGITVREITTAYAALANDGIYTHSVTYTRVLDSEGDEVFNHEVGDQEVAFKADVAGQMTAMLLNAVNTGTGTAARISGYDVAGKTGTTGDNKDRYFAGYTVYYTAAVWTGYINNESTAGLTGTNPACLVFKDIMLKAHEATGKEPASFEDLPSLSGKSEASDSSVQVCLDSGLLATDACRNDLRGSRATSYSGDEDSAPTQSCNLHVSVTVCDETSQLPNGTCNTVVKGTLSSNQGAIGTCTVQHDHQTVTEEPDDGGNQGVETPGGDNGGGTTTEPETPVEPETPDNGGDTTEPETPEVPMEPTASGVSRYSLLSLPDQTAWPPDDSLRRRASWAMIRAA